MKIEIRPLLFALTAPALGLLLVAARPAQGDRVEGLLQERLVTLVKIEELVRAQHREGRVGLREVVEATLERHDAELALADTPEERVAILERELAAATQLEEHVAEMVKAGVAPEQESLRMRALRLAVAIELERAR